MKEIFKKIPGYSLYEVSNYGNIKTFNWKGCGRERIMKPALDNSGYYRTVLIDDFGRYRTIKVHRMVAITWCVNPENKPEVNHKDGVKTNNRWDNLEWVTHMENCKHAHENGLNKYFKGSSNGYSKLTESEVIEIRSKFKKYIYGRERLAKEYNVKPATIKDVVTRKSWRHI